MSNWIKQSLQQAAWAPLTVFIFYAVAAKGFNAYLIYPWLDMPTHFFGGLAMTYFYLVLLQQSQRLVGAIPRLILFSFPLGLTAITAALWEFLEFLSDAAFGTKMNLGVSDTLSDQFFGLLGGAVLLAAYLWSTRVAVRYARISAKARG